jgi:hypothetical protein
MNCPYSAIELKIALLNLPEDAVNPEKSEIVENIIKNEFPETTHAEINKRVAEDNGISVETLINSPNYTILIEQFHNQLFKRTINLMQEHTGMSEIQAWAVIATAQGLL